MRFTVKALSPLLGVLLLVLAWFFLEKELAQFSFAAVARYWGSLGPVPLGLAVGFTVANYLVLAGYDQLGVRYAGVKLGYPRILLSSFVAYSFSNNFGFSGLSGAAVRLRFYTAFGVDAGATARVVGFGFFTFWVGLLAVAGTAFLVAPPAVPFSLVGGVPFQVAGGLCLGVLGVYVAGVLVARGPLRVGRFEVPRPGPRLLAAQLPVSALDWILGAACFFVLLPPRDEVTFVAFVSVFVLATLAGLVSNIPAGLGVFDWVVVTALSPFYPTGVLLSVLVVYRGIYLVGPLVVALGLLAAHELYHLRDLLRWAARFLREAVQDFLPNLVSAMVFLFGVVLFVGASPHRLAAAGLGGHFAATLLGLVLVVLSLRVGRLVASVYWLVVVILVLALGLLVATGVTWAEVTTGVATLLLVLVVRKRVRPDPPSPRSVPLVLVGLVLGFTGVATLTGVFWTQGLPLPPGLFWQSPLDQVAPWLLTVPLALAVVGTVLALVQLVRRGPPAPAPDDPNAVVPLVEACGKAYDQLAFLGDKRFFFNEPRDAFLMYGVAGPAWVCLGDPVGPADRHDALVGAFLAHCHAQGGQPVFYEVGTDNLASYLSAGLKVRKIGEVGVIDLSQFSLENKERRRLRYYRNHLEKDGCRFVVLAPDEVAAHLDELEAVSQAWLETKNVREKRFSLGYFHPDYLRRFPVAVVYHHDRLVAFANLLVSRSHQEMAADLMRYLPGAVDHVMDYLFTSLLLYAKAEGYRHYNLGMSPLSGLQRAPYAGLWNRVAGLLYDHGDYLYNFKGLRDFKNQYQPVWQPRFLVSKGGWSTPLTLLRIASLVGGGVSGVVGKERGPRPRNTFTQLL